MRAHRPRPAPNGRHRGPWRCRETVPPAAGSRAWPARSRLRRQCGNSRLRRRLREARHLAQHAQGMFVDRVHMEQVVLHAPEDLAEGRQNGRQQPMPVHPPQGLYRWRTSPQQTAEKQQEPSCRRPASLQRGGCLVDPSHRVGTESDHARLVQPRQEHFHQRRGPLHEQGSDRAAASASPYRRKSSPTAIASPGGCSISSNRSATCTPSARPGWQRGSSPA